MAKLRVTDETIAAASKALEDRAPGANTEGDNLKAVAEEHGTFEEDFAGIRSEVFGNLMVGIELDTDAISDAAGAFAGVTLDDEDFKAELLDVLGHDGNAHPTVEQIKRLADAVNMIYSELVASYVGGFLTAMELAAQQLPDEEN